MCSILSVHFYDDGNFSHFLIRKVSAFIARTAGNTRITYFLYGKYSESIDWPASASVGWNVYNPSIKRLLLKMGPLKSSSCYRSFQSWWENVSILVMLLLIINIPHKLYEQPVLLPFVMYVIFLLKVFQEITFLKSSSWYRLFEFLSLPFQLVSAFCLRYYSHFVLHILVTECWMTADNVFAGIWYSSLFAPPHNIRGRMILEMSLRLDSYEAILIHRSEIFGSRNIISICPISVNKFQ